VRLLQSDAPEIAACLASGHYLIARGSRANFHGCLGNFAILGLIVLARSVGIPHAFALGVALLAVWNLMLRWRVVFGNQSWMFLGSEEGFYIRVFRPLRLNSGRPPEACVIAMDASEVDSISVQTREVFVHGPKPRIYEWLVIQPKPEPRSFLAEQGERFCPPGGT
jgi:hypothetical protein